MAWAGERADGASARHFTFDYAAGERVGQEELFENVSFVFSPKVLCDFVRLFLVWLGCFFLCVWVFSGVFGCFETLFCLFFCSMCFISFLF